ncbi:MAG TPA: hypothetical protein VGO73_03870 [Pyrinomonadaceae bacterium]|jgi:hypothetical protein|nr:hypothetical protein [Pyrinomonadaceae bacterium]
MEDFQKLGALVENRWRAENYSEQLFPEIAAQALAETDLPARVDPWEIIRWVHTAVTLPEQHDVEGRFGNPPITLFSGPRFYIDVYYWLDGTTSIHQHSFTGAFQVLLGSSIHSRYSFSEDRIINEHFSVGELALEEVQLLKLRDVRTIRAGRNFIHSLFHLDRPSATITIRTQHTPSAALQYDYRKPHFALDPFFRNPVLIKKLQTLGLLLGMKHKDADAMIGDLVCRSDFHTAYLILAETFQQLQSNEMDTLFGLSTGKDRFKAILERCKDTHGELTDLVLPVLEEQERQGSITKRRGTITKDAHRFFLALLLNVPSRDKVLELVKQRYPEQDPVETILDWVEELGRTRVLGSKETNALGLPEFDDSYVFVLECLLEGLSDEQINQRVAAQYPPDNAMELITRIPALKESLKESSLFKSLLAD